MNRLGLNRNLGVMCGTSFGNVFMMNMWNPLLPLYYRALGANDLEIGLAFTLMGIARTLFAIFGGALADRYGRRALLAFPTLVIVPLYWVAANTGHWTILLAALLTANAMSALSGPAFTALIVESSTEDRVANAFSLTEFSVIAALIGGPIAGAALLGVLDIPALILLNAAVLFGTALTRGLALNETRHRTVEKTSPKLRAALDGNVRWFLVLGTLVTMAFSLSFGPYFAILSRDVWHNSESEINLLFAAGNAASLLGIGLGRLSDRWGARRVFAVGMLGYGISVLAWGFAPGWQWGLVPLLIAFGFSEGAFIAMQTLQAEITTRETRSSVFGIIMAVTGVIGGLGPALGAWLITFGGNPMPFLAAGVIALVTTVSVGPIRSKQVVGLPTAAAAVQAE